MGGHGCPAARHVRSNSVAARISSPKDKFWAGLQRLRACEHLDASIVSGMMCNGVASRLDASYGDCIARMATHMAMLGGPDRRRTFIQLFYNSPYTRTVPEISARMLTLGSVHE